MPSISAITFQAVHYCAPIIKNDAFYQQQLWSAGDGLIGVLSEAVALPQTCHGLLPLSPDGRITPSARQFSHCIFANPD